MLPSTSLLATPGLGGAPRPFQRKKRSCTLHKKSSRLRKKNQKEHCHETALHTNSGLDRLQSPVGNNCSSMGNQTGGNYKSASTIVFSNIYYFSSTLQLKENLIS